jgi:hypothetical protein
MSRGNTLCTAIDDGIEPDYPLHDPSFFFDRGALAASSMR